MLDCPVCGCDEHAFDHEECEAVQQVEPYDPSASEPRRKLSTLA